MSLMGWWYAKNVKSRLAVVQYYDELRDRSVRILQRFLKKKIRKIRSARSAGAIPMILKKVLVRHWRKKSIEKIKFFLAESAKNQKSKIIRRFIYRVKKLQIKIKKWVESNNARREVLLRYWDFIERSYRKRLSDENAAAIQARIEQEKRLKKRHRPLIQEQWNKTKENVGKLLKKATRVQNKYSREKASQMGAEPSIHSMGSVLYGEFDGKIPESERLRVINETVSLKRKLHMLRQRQEKDMVTKNIQAKSKVSEELVRRLLVNYRGYSVHVVRVMMQPAHEVRRRQQDRFTRAANVCFLTNPNLGPSFKSIIEGMVWKDIVGKKEAAALLEQKALDSRRKLSPYGGGGRKASSLPYRAPPVIGGILKHSSPRASPTEQFDDDSTFDGELMNAQNNGASPRQSNARKRSVRIVDHTTMT